MITVEIKSNPSPVEPKYPYIGRWKGAPVGDVVVLFTAPNEGFRLNGSTPGESGKAWSEVEYTPLQGSISLTQ